MNIWSELAGDGVVRLAADRPDVLEEFVCWSRMQAEAGQQLDAIVARKERERQAGDGCFLWGVGNAPAVITRVLARAQVPVRVVFSIMKTPPKSIDLTPTRTFVWRRYVDAHGVDRPLPDHVLITSRGDSAKGAKRSHYALMCQSSEPLEIRRGNSFNPGAYRNAGGTGAPVGASQVTALLRKVHAETEAAGYEANLTAWLTGSYWVRLTDPIELSLGKLQLLEGLSSHCSSPWKPTVAAIRAGQPAPSESAPRDLLL